MSSTTAVVLPVPGGPWMSATCLADSARDTAARCDASSRAFTGFHGGALLANLMRSIHTTHSQWWHGWRLATRAGGWQRSASHSVRGSCALGELKPTGGWVAKPRLLELSLLKASPGSCATEEHICEGGGWACAHCCTAQALQRLEQPLVCHLRLQHPMSDTHDKGSGALHPYGARVERPSGKRIS